MGGDPISGSNNAPYPSGYAPISAALDWMSIEQDKMSKCAYYSTSKLGQDHEHKIRPGDVVFTLRGAGDHETKDKTLGMVRVRSSLTGLSSIPGTGVNLHDQLKLHQKGDPEVDLFVQDLVSAQIQLMGVANGEADYNHRIKQTTGGFAVAVAGVAQVNVHDYMPVGAIAQAIPPLRKEFTQPDWAPKRGEDPNKIPLKVVPVTPDDLGNFMLRAMHRFIHRRHLSSELDPLKNNVFGGRGKAEAQTCAAFKNFALVSGLLFLNQLLRYDVVTPPTKHLADQAGQFNKQDYRAFSSAGAHADKRRQARNVPAESRRHGLGHCVAPSRDELLADGDLARNLDELYPEEITTIVAGCTGLFGPPHALGIMTANNTNKGEAIVHKIARSPQFAEERKDWANLTDDFLKSVFLARNKMQKGHSKMHEFGYMDYDRAAQHLGRSQNSNAGHILSIDRRTMSGQLLSAQLCSLFDVMRGIQNVFYVHRSRCIGRVLKAGEKGGQCDIYINSAI